MNTNTDTYTICTNTNMTCTGRDTKTGSHANKNTKCIYRDTKTFTDTHRKNTTENRHTALQTPRIQTKTQRQRLEIKKHRHKNTNTDANMTCAGRETKICSQANTGRDTNTENRHTAL